MTDDNNVSQSANQPTNGRREEIPANDVKASKANSFSKGYQETTTEGYVRDKKKKQQADYVTPHIHKHTH